MHLIFFLAFSSFLSLKISSTNRKWLKDIKTKIHESVGSVFPMNSSVIYLDAPNHWNLGDSFIWLGSKIFFDERNIKVLAEHYQNWNKKELLNIAQKNENSIVALHGGGNYGDLYLLHQRTRFRAFGDFPSIKKVVMPQSVFYTRPSKIAEDSQKLESFSNINFFCRCGESLRIMKQHSRNGKVNYLLAPDMAFMIGDVESVEEPTFDVIFISRKGEKRREIENAEALRKLLSSKGISILIVDWDEWGRYMRPNEIVPNSNNDNSLSKFRLEMARRMLSKGKIVLSDRMHAIILGLLMDKPVVALDNFYDKFGRLYDTFLSEYSDEELKLKRVKTFEEACNEIELFKNSL